MLERGLSTLFAALLVCCASSCDTGGTALTAGAAGNAPAQTCQRTSDCTAQVCSPDGRCIDCYDNSDCRADQRCEAEHCVAEGAVAAGSGGSGGSSAGAAGGSAGSAGGASTPSQCGGVQVLLVIQRSGAMFEEPSSEESYFGMVRSAVTGADGVAASYGSKLELGALFFVRLDEDRGMSCPVVSSSPPQAAAQTPLEDLFSGNESSYEALADEQAKMDAPVPEAVAAAAALLSGASRHVVLITTAVPDSCTLSDSNCTVDLAVKAVQDAQSQGVTTHVIGLGDTGNLDASDDDEGYATYLRQLANAGAGQPVAMSAAFDEQCGDHDATASYADASGTAEPYRAESAAELKSALTQILTELCP